MSRVAGDSRAPIADALWRMMWRSTMSRVGLRPVVGASARVMLARGIGRLVILLVILLLCRDELDEILARDDADEFVVVGYDRDGIYIVLDHDRRQVDHIRVLVDIDDRRGHEI